MVKNVIKLILVLSSFLLFTGCGEDFVKPTKNEIDAFLQANPDLSELDKACIIDGRFEVGMSKKAIVFLLGEPDEIEIVQQPWAKQEKLIYTKGADKAFYIEDGGVVGIEEEN